jgi:hypothetical protein
MAPIVLQRVEWMEKRPVPFGGFEPYFMRGDYIANSWTFYERSTWEVCWYQTPATVERIYKARQMTRDYVV